MALLFQENIIKMFSDIDYKSLMLAHFICIFLNLEIGIEPKTGTRHYHIT